MFQTLSLLCLLATTPWIFPPPSLSAGVLSDSTLKTQEPNLVWSELDDRMEIVHDDSPRNPFARVQYPLGKWGSSNSGAQFLVKLAPSKSYTADYYVRFAEDFDFVRGGKLPGLAGGEATAGVQRPTGDGWTARYMWRSGGRAVVYLYHLDQRKDYGDDLELGCSFERGKWHRLTQRVTVNDPDQANGQIQVWFDGKLSLDQKGLRLRTGNRASVDRFYFSTFFGGSGRKWAPQSDITIDFSRITVEQQ